MDLHSGLPYWIIKNSLFDYYKSLKKDLETDIVIIGSGITGALMTHELCRTGLECCVVDKRSIATGSSAASTALLQYLIICLTTPEIFSYHKNHRKTSLSNW